MNWVETELRVASSAEMELASAIIGDDVLVCRCCSMTRAVSCKDGSCEAECITIEGETK